MKRIEILAEETLLTIEKVKYYTDSDEFFITGRQALEAMRQFGELAWKESRSTLNSNRWHQITFDEWLKNKEEQK